MIDNSNYYQLTYSVTDGMCRKDTNVGKTVGSSWFNVYGTNNYWRMWRTDVIDNSGALMEKSCSAWEIQTEEIYWRYWIQIVGFIESPVVTGEWRGSKSYV